MHAEDVEMGTEGPGDIMAAGDADQTRKPTRDGLIANFVAFLRDLDPQGILPHLLQKDLLDFDEYKLFTNMNSTNKRSEVVNKVLCTILQKDAAKSGAMKLLHEVLVTERYHELADLLCSPVASSPSAESRRCKKPRQWEMVQLGDLEEEQERLGIAACMRVLHTSFWENTAAEFVVGQGDHARRLHVLLQTYQLDQELLFPGSNLLLSDGAWVGGHLVASSRCLSRTGHIPISESGLTQAETLMSALSNKESAAFGIPLQIIMEAPVESTHSTTVDILSVELRKQVVGLGDMRHRVDFQVQDSTGEMPAELWNMADVEIQPGQKWRFFGKVVENKQKKKIFRILKADCVDRTWAKPGHSWLSSDGHMESQLYSFEIFIYDTCSKSGCPSKKLGSDKTCKTCGTSFVGSLPTPCAYADLKFIQDGTLVELRAFTPEISQLYAALGSDLDLHLPKKHLEQQVLQAIPLQCGVRYEGSIIMNIRCWNVRR